MKTQSTRPGSVPGTKDQMRHTRPDAGQVFSTFVRNLEELGKGSRQRPQRPKGKSA
jgi:hypothetical protein